MNVPPREFVTSCTSCLAKRFGKVRVRFLALLTATGLLPLTAGYGQWINTNQAWPPSEVTQNWASESNWQGGNIPGPAALVFWTNPGTAYISSAVSIARLYLGNNSTNPVTRGIWIGEGGSLAVSANFELTQTAGNQWIQVDTGGALSATGAIRFDTGTAGDGTSVITNKGATTSSGLFLAKYGVFEMLAGTYNSSGSFIIGASGSRNADEGQFIQKGGAVTLTGSAAVQMNPGSTYEISGGSLNVANNLWIHSANEIPYSEGGSLGATFRVIGSQATSITFTEGLRYFTNNDRNKMTWSFVLDNGEDHITKIEFTNDVSSTSTLRGGTLDVGLNGGVLLSGGKVFTLFQAPTISNTTNFINAADFEGELALWHQKLETSGTPDLLQIELNIEQRKGTLDASLPNEPITFAKAAYGYVDLVNVDLDAPLVLALDVTGGNLANFTNALDAAGITWQAGSGDYEVNLILNPGGGGGNYFAWDFAGIDSSMGLQGLMIVPEPTTTAMMIGSLGVLLLLRRRSVR